MVISLSAFGQLDLTSHDGYLQPHDVSHRSRQSICASVCIIMSDGNSLRHNPFHLNTPFYLAILVGVFIHKVRESLQLL